MRIYRTAPVGLCILCMALLTVGCQPGQKTTGDTVPDEVKAPDSDRSKQQFESVEPEGDYPIIQAEKEAHDFGEMGPGASANCEYNFTNVGTADLKITRIISTCGCAIPELKKKVYAPGESGVIKLRFTAPKLKGKVEKHIYIVSNDPKYPRFELDVKAKVVVKVSISPEMANLRFDQENAGMPDIVVKSLDDREFSIKSVTNAGNTMKITFDPKKKAKEFTLKPVVDIKKLLENNKGSIIVNADHPQAGTLAVGYEALPPYELQRPRMILQNVKPEVPMLKDNFIRSNYGTPVEIVSATSRNNYMEIANQQRDGEHLRFQVKITPPPKSAKRYLKDEMTLTLKDGYAVKITCSGWYKR